jgi:predicted glycosyltransferase
LEFTDDLMSYMEAVDVVVAMGGYNTFCEILSAQKPSIIIPRVRPSQEQLIRANRMSKLGVLTQILPEKLSPKYLMRTVFHQLKYPNSYITNIGQLDLDALPRITRHISALLASADLRENTVDTVAEYLCA